MSGLSLMGMSFLSREGFMNEVLLVLRDAEEGLSAIPGILRFLLSLRSCHWKEPSQTSQPGPAPPSSRLYSHHSDRSPGSLCQPLYCCLAYCFRPREFPCQFPNRITSRTAMIFSVWVGDFYLLKSLSVLILHVSLHHHPSGSSRSF